MTIRDCFTLGGAAALAAATFFGILVVTTSPHSDKAAALVMLGRWEEAELAARRALQLDPASIETNYMLGIAMLQQSKITPETAAHLAIAAKEHPRARAFLAEVQADLAAEPKN
jgi:Flp pilus assembly protein TadD